MTTSQTVDASAATSLPPTAVEGAVKAPRKRRRGLAPGRRLPASRVVGPLLFLVLWTVASAAGQLDPAAIPAPWTVLRTAYYCGPPARCPRTC